MDDDIVDDLSHPPTRTDDRDEQIPPARAVERSAWERALDGPPINPRSALIYHDPK